VVTGGPLRFAVVGDTTLDVTVRGSAPPPGTDQVAEIQAGPGGQGANVAVRLARAGAAVRLVTAIGTDPAGRVLEAILVGEGVAVMNVGAASSGLVVSLVDASGERAMASDRISLDPDRIDAAVAEVLAEADWLHVSGYPLADPLSGERLALVVSRRADVRCSVGGGLFHRGSVITDRLRAARPDIVQFDHAEAEAILAESVGHANGLSAAALATALAEALGAVTVVTDGAAGAAAATAHGAVTVPAPALSGRDATGAGDAHAASILLSLASRSWPPSLHELRAALDEAAGHGAQVAEVVGAQGRIPAEDGA
jgi:sugar/nucleoside kinase (ribokinase family)